MTRKHKILLVVRHPVGGIRTFFRYVYRYFGCDRYQFTLIAPEFPETRELLKDLRDLDLKYVPTDRNVSNGELFRIVTRLVRHERFDLVHSHGFTSATCSVFGALFKGMPHILTCHDVFTEGQFIGLKGFFKKTALGLMLSLVDRIHCVSHDARDNLLTYLPILKVFEHKVIAVPNGIDVDIFLNAERRDLRRELGLPGKSFLIGFLGRFMSQKGFRYLVDALEQIKKVKNLPKEPVILAFSAHDGFIREEKEEVKNRGLAESVHFLPFVPDVASTLKGLDVVAMPSLWEACGLLAMETMVAGVPIIGTDCVGLREVLQDTPAHVVPPKNSVVLAEALMMEMNNPTTARAKPFAVQAAARFQVKERAKEIEDLVLKFLDRQKTTDQY